MPTALEGTQYFIVFVSVAVDVDSAYYIFSEISPISAKSLATNSSPESFPKKTSSFSLHDVINLRTFNN